MDSLGRAHCLLFPSAREAAGWVVAEAASLGTPVLAFDIGGPRALATYWENIRLVPLDARAIHHLVEALTSLECPKPEVMQTNAGFALDELSSFLAEAYSS
jgi:glycosyltransferase involved in cell wall biosynthesis